MALIECTECSRAISDRAKNCPHCGVPRYNLADDLAEALSGLDIGLLFLPLVGLVGFFLPFLSVQPSKLTPEFWFLAQPLSTSGWEILKATWGLFWGLFDSGYPASDLIQLGSELAGQWSDETKIVIGFIAFTSLGPIGFGFFALLEAIVSVGEAVDPATRSENASIPLTLYGLVYAAVYSGALYLIANGVASNLPEPQSVWSVFFNITGAGYYLSVSSLILLFMSKCLRFVNDHSA